jgi:DNA-binding transcriptional LysR family regulator
MDRLEAMQVFVAVADLKGFAAAGRRVRRSPSAVTRLVAALEDHLGARLLQRTTRSVTLTDAGARYLDRARRILAEVAEAEGAALAERSMPSGHLVVSAPTLFGRLHVAPLVSAYLFKYPKVTAELGLTDRPVQLVDEGIDLAVRIGVLEDASFVARVLGETRRVVVASPGYLRRRKAPETPAALARHQLIHVTALSPTPSWRFMHGEAEQRIAFVPRYTTSSVDAGLDHAERGGGLTLALAYQVVEAVRAGRLTVVLSAFEPPPLPISMVYPTSRLLSAKVRAFVELAKATSDWHFTKSGSR